MATPEIASGGKRAFVARRLLVLSGAVALGLLLQDVLRARLDAIAVLAEDDMLAARAQLALVLRIVGALVFGVTGALGVAIALSSRRVRDARERLGAGVGVALLLLSAAALALIWYLAAVLAACRA
jgi:hypothetical protein